MRSWFRDIWRHVTGRTDNPVYRRELSGWSYFAPWTSIQKGCAPLMAGVFLISTVLCGSVCALITVPSLDPDTVWIGVILGAAGALIFGLFLGETLLRFATTMAALVLGSTTISAEVESQTFSLLRLTSLPARDIVLGKFGAVVQQVRLPMIVVLIARLLMLVLLVLGGAVGAILMLLGLQADGALMLPALSTGEWIALIAPYFPPGIAALATGVLMLTYALFQPVVYVLFFAALGVFSSSLARTRSNGIVTAALMRILVIIGSYILGQFIGLAVQLVMLPAIFLGPLLTDATSLALPAVIGLVTLAMIIGVLGNAALEIGATWLILAAAASRTQGIRPVR